MTLHNRDLERSLKVIQTGTIRKIGCVFLFAQSPSIVTTAVSLTVYEIMRYSASKNSVILKSGLVVVQGYYLKTAPFDRSHTTFYRFAIVNIALSCTVFELFDVE